MVAVKILADLRRYNANTRDSFVGDCVKRSLTLAFGMDYDEVSKELNRIKRSKGASAYNIGPVYGQFLKDRGYSFSKYPDKNVTVQEFSQSHNVGTYLLLTGGSKLAVKGISDHMVAIIDGDIWDSWDSSNEIVVSYCKITGETTDFESVNVWHIIDDLEEYMASYCEQLNHKFPFGTIDEYDIGNSNNIYNRYTATLKFRIVFEDVPEDYSWFRGRSKVHSVVAKMNPKYSSQENLEMLKPKIKQKVYDWVYNIRKELQDAEDASKLEVNVCFYGNRSDLMKAPEWARPLITGFRDNGPNSYGDRFEVYMDALPGDPRGESNPEVSFYAETLTELKSQFKAYKEDYSRFGYDF